MDGSKIELGVHMIRLTNFCFMTSYWSRTFPVLKCREDGRGEKSIKNYMYSPKVSIESTKKNKENWPGEIFLFFLLLKLSTKKIGMRVIIFLSRELRIPDQNEY